LPVPEGASKVRPLNSGAVVGLRLPLINTRFVLWSIQINGENPAVPVTEETDRKLRVAAFNAVRRLSEVRGDLTSKDLAAGFEFEGVRFPLVNPQRGIFKPRQMRYLLSIKTVIPRSGARVWYDDQTKVHQQIYEGDETVSYDFMGQDQDAADNRWLREAMENRVPIIYFLGVSPGLYQAIVPAFVAEWNAGALKAEIAFSMAGRTDLAPPRTAIERHYALRAVKQRLHQASFREAVFTAYNGRCALSALPETRLLDAAHIIADADEEYGQPVIQNGIPLSKIHHAAFDAHLIGINPDFRIHVSARLLGQNDGPMLEVLKKLHHEKLHLPSRTRDNPDRDRLAMRFDVFRGFE
jgi:putative restriction endonuclease